MKIQIKVIIFLGILLLGFTPIESPDPIPDKILKSYQKSTDTILYLFEKLYTDSGFLDKEEFIEAVIELRRKLKRTETISAFFDSYSYNRIFAPNIYKVEYEFGEPGEVQEPIGLQRIEELLDEDANKEELNLELHKLTYVFKELQNYSKYLQLSDELLFLAFKYQLIRVQTLGITGFDSPVYSNCLSESAEALKGMLEYIQFYIDEAPTISAENLKKSIQKAIHYLEINGDDFDTFDRLTFIKDYINPTYKYLILLQDKLGIKDVGSDKKNVLAINQRSFNIYDADFLNPYFFHKSKIASNSEKIKELGKLLFFDPILSRNNQRACASCHQPSRAFAENRKTSLALDGTSLLNRNSPTLVNAAFQTKFQIDGRADTPERQMHLVLFNPDEMGSTENSIIEKLLKSDEYRKLFKNAFNTEAEINFSMVKYALGVYIRSLIALNSSFDRYMRGELTQLPENVKNGFNLFMGKAACATCHFPPIFNGTVPPEYSETEIEVLGVTKNGDFQNSILDDDLGAFFISQIEYHKFGFKTPTIRNIALTAPYMHNGSFSDLEKVMEFYNEGGGAGLGLNVTFQTLPADKLNLSSKEISDIIAFMEILTDTTNITDTPKKLPEFPNNPEWNNRKIGGVY